MTKASSIRTLFVLVAAVLPGSALALDRSLDTQQVQPVMLPGAVLAVDTSRVPVDSAIIGGAAWQVEHLPLEYFENTLPAGAAHNPDLRLRFKTNAKGKQERAEIYAIFVIGTP